MGRIFVSIFFPFLFSIFGPVLSTCREGTPVTGFFVLFVPSQKAFWPCFPVVSGQEFLVSWLVFLACVTHPIFGPGLALLGVVSPIPFLGQVRIFGCGFFGLFSPVSIVCQDFLVSFSCGFGPCVFVRTFLLLF